MPYDPQIAIPTLTGSVLSCVATASVLISYIVYADQQRSFRHALVLNLALAEFINSLNNTISGIYAIKHAGVLTTGPACTLNGWVGQWSVQAADFSILAIAIITLLTITRKTYMPAASLAKKVLICASVWFVPTITASTAAGLHQMKPVSGNWCWISASRTDLRYALGHGWRFAIILGTVCIYLYVWWYMRRHFSQLHGPSFFSKSTGGKNPSSFGATEKRSRGSGFFPDDFEMGPRNESQTQLHEGEISVEYHFEVRHSDSSEAPVSAPAVAADGAGHKKHDSHLVGAIPGGGGGGAGGLLQSSGSNRSSMASAEDPYGNPVSELYSPTEIKPALFAFKTGGTAVVESLSAAAAAPPHTSHRFSLSHHAHSHRFSLPHHSHHHNPRPAAASPPRNDNKQPSSSPPSSKPSNVDPEKPTTAPAAKNRTSTLSGADRSSALEREVRRMLLLNAYPVLYVLLWLPGLSNRVVEAVTGRPDRALAVLQCSTQFVGLANALTYGFNEHLRERVREGVVGWWSSSGSGRGWGRRGRGRCGWW